MTKKELEKQWKKAANTVNNKDYNTAVLSGINNY